MKGIGVSPGISIGKAYVLKARINISSGKLLKSNAEVIAETELFDRAVNLAIAEIEAIKKDPLLALGDEDFAILETQIEFLSDPQIKADVSDKIYKEKKNANDALIEVIGDVVQLFQKMEDEYLRARSADVQDIGNRILKHLNKGHAGNHQIFNPDTIIIADDITPSDTITMDVNNVVGFATRAGSKTSHTAIIAKSKGIPAVIGCGDDLLTISSGDVVVLDGEQGLVYVNPDQDVLSEYKKKRAAYTDHLIQLKTLKNISSITTDGTAVSLLANISGADDMQAVFENGGGGVGLLRTEMLFMNRNSFPTEDEQFEFYKQVAIKSKNKPVIIRTIDIGGDKQLPYLNLPAEQNPFLGYRAIRICLDRPELFITQLKAILRASLFGDLRIMLPMISGVEELRVAKKILEQSKDELLRHNIPFNRLIKLGIMIEIPSAAMTADILAKEVDFFSIGTNDLCQYTLAVDRMNEKIAHLYDPFNPGVLRLIDNVIKQANKHHIHVGMCGEMASDPNATLLLLGMGLRDFSMGAGSIPSIKNIIIKSSILTAKQVYKKVMEIDNSQSILAYLREAAQ